MRGKTIIPTRAGMLLIVALFCLTEAEAQQAPANLTASRITANSAKISWKGNAGSYNLRYATATGGSFSDGFEEGIAAKGWTTVRNGEGDENTDWQIVYNNHSGDYGVMSRSWSLNTGDIHADNWLISPEVPLGGTLTYWMQVSSDYPDHHEIWVSTATTGIDDFELVSDLDYTPGDWVEVTVDLSSYAGQTGYVAFRHVDDEKMYIYIDDVTVSAPIENSEPWTTVNDVNSPYTISGLTPEAQYAVQVQAADGSGDWTTIIFTTPSATATPTELAATDVKTTRSTVDWAGSQGDFTLRYRHLTSNNTAPATVILTNYDCIWPDGSGYQMLLDADATAYGTIIPDEGPLTRNGDASAETYAMFEYKIPENADGALTTQNIVRSNSVSIQIPAGTYDWCITNPTPGDCLWIASSSGEINGRYDNFVFEPGLTYEFTMRMPNSNDGVYLTVTHPMTDWTVVENVTAPYKLTGLECNTFYEWQVQGNLAEGTTEWSETGSFTTLEANDKAISLANNADNTEVIELSLDGHTHDVTLADRTLSSGNWNTLCLPFNVPLAGSPLAGADVRTLSSASMEGSKLILNFTSAGTITELVAGTPYIVRFTGSSIASPTFTDVTFDSTMNNVECDLGNNRSITFKGTYTLTDEFESPRSILYMGSDNKLYYPGSTSFIGAQRAYFQLDGIQVASSSQGAGIKGFSMNFEDDPTSMDEEIRMTGEACATTPEWHTLDGRKLEDKPTQKGIYIVSGRKTIVK